ncbi:helix-turn-helix domain-containing protein [Marinicrinis sediminis]|uniref:Helix-turn-helix domain-containing protein n=1 Tax=Marinicrinis sediminis TaxID=1652465 RepID=A0ABW5R7A9_9BACL
MDTHAGKQSEKPNRSDRPERLEKLILHPVRMRIIQALVDGAQLTAKQLLERLDDVSQATLYRHIQVLEQAHLITVTEQIRKRGTLERIFMLPEHQSPLTLQALEKVSSEEHFALFMKFATHVMADFGEYVHQSSAQLMKDGVTYRQVPLWLSDAENEQLIRQMRELIERAAQNKPRADRRRRSVTTIIFPEAEADKASEEAGDDPS